MDILRKIVKEELLMILNEDNSEIPYSISPELLRRRISKLEEENHELSQFKYQVEHIVHGLMAPANEKLQLLHNLIMDSLA